MSRTPILLIGAGLIAAGLALGGYFVGDGFYEGRRDNRLVTVKGLSERVVKADNVQWPLHLSSTSDSLETAQGQLARDVAVVQRFFVDAGLARDAMVLQRLQVTDQLANPWQNGPIQGNRFIISQNILINTGDVDTVQGLTQLVGELVSRGVVLQDPSGPSYSFTRLSDIKPEMVAEATRDARAAAEQFARDSGSELGTILTASQGYFSIEPAVDTGPYSDANSQLDKKVRVVTTVDFALVD